MPPFAHLSVRSSYSLKEGALAPEAVAFGAKAAGMDRVALTDRDSLAGAVRFTRACEQAGIAPVYGRSVRDARGDRLAP